MQRLLAFAGFIASGLAFGCGPVMAAEALTVASDFEGASVRDVAIDNGARRISFMPGGDPARGWPCWWFFRVDGITPGETITLRLHGTTAASSSPASPSLPASPAQKPLDPKWSMPAQATFSSDEGRTWLHTDKGERRDQWMIYTLKPDARSVLVAWGPPYTPSTAAKFIREVSERSPRAAEAVELCRSRQGRPVPMLHVREGERSDDQRFGIWVQARQHAWETGSSWVAEGFTEWLLEADDSHAAWLRQHAEVFIIPIMDVDNVASGNGGKDAPPQDHNRDWSDHPHWNEVAAAQRRVAELIRQGRMDIFLDLHNPSPSDPTFFYMLPPELLHEPMLGLCNRFMDLARARFVRLDPPFPLRDQPKLTGPDYHPLWRQMSSNWVALHGNPHTVSLCLETTWNCPSSTTQGYRAVGAALAATVREYLAERPERAGKTEKPQKP